MLEARKPLYLTIAAWALLAAALLLYQPYSVSSPWDDYTALAHGFLRAAERGDSAALARQASSPAPVAWALRAARSHPDSLGVWARYAREWAGLRNGDTAKVVLQTNTDICADDRLTVEFVGTGSGARVTRMSSACLDAR
jgi:hypothetical protein